VNKWEARCRYTPLRKEAGSSLRPRREFMLRASPPPRRHPGHCDAPQGASDRGHGRASGTRERDQDEASDRAKVQAPAETGMKSARKKGGIFISREDSKPVQSHALPIRGAKLELPRRKDFDLDFIPIHGPTRRARRAIVGRMFFVIDAKIFRREADPYEAQELTRQEERGQADLEAVRAVFGRKSDWRTALCYEARRKGDAKRELGMLMADAAARGDTKDLSCFCSAVQMVNKVSASGPDKESRFAATLFGINHEIKTGKLPTRPLAKRYLSKIGLLPKSLEKGSRGANDKRFFSGPYLSRFPPGKPWETTA
jgi:hypothetical protein